MADKKRVYLFEEGNAQMRGLLGGKGANLAEMTNIGLPVPPGFTITTETCNEYTDLGQAFPTGLMEEIQGALKAVEKKTGKMLGNPENPLLVSVRSGAVFSMPGMMDTVLNLGLNSQTVLALAGLTGNERFAYDAYRRFIMMFSDVVMGIGRKHFEELLDEKKKALGAKLDTDLDAAALKELVVAYKHLYKVEKGEDFPEDPMEQLRLAVKAVFDSWNNPRAFTYRNINKIPHDLGTAVNVQMMVFGNMGDDSGTGVAFTRNPSTGENLLYGEYLVNAQGEDVVAGVRTPQPISKLKQDMPEVFNEFVRISLLLEKHYCDMQDLEFTIERGTLYMLQCRSGKRTAAAAVKIAVDMANDNFISADEAVLRVEPAQLDQLLHRRIDPAAAITPIAKGLPASPGAAFGEVVFTANRAEELSKTGKKVILVRMETNPDDIHGLVASQGVLTSRGGMTSHAAVVARGMGKPCVAGCEAIKVDADHGLFSVGDVTVKEGDIITIDGATGNVMVGSVPMIEPTLSGEFITLLKWADERRRLRVRTNADTPEDALKAFEFGAEGVGLCRTEHMFMAQDRLPAVQQMILAETEAERRLALDKLLPMQKSDFAGIFKAMQGQPVTIRLIDPPLHEFLPRYEDLLEEVVTLKIKKPGSKELEEKEALLVKVEALREFNPMLGLRGCRLGILFPEIVEMQVQAIFGAAVELAKDGFVVRPEVMIPLVGHVNEIKRVREQLESVARDVMDKAGVSIDYSFGTMIEIPRAALTADQIAEYAEFFSFGTNDLTQTTFGYSRDDAEGKFLFYYMDQKILNDNPFEVLDQQGVGKLMKQAVEAGRKVRPDIKLGICGEHGGEPSSVKFCHEIGLNYVSCSPYRVPIARLAAAQANISMKIVKDK
ncbi:MAG: pyruvate, phosphate dikinase [bacterium]|nr:pyruvate, phosphate dikinase [bacterium]MDD4152177.1 pyruvate, phosphate dikinase [bacterium]MDD4557693.1 pyruvate, phosphate dikinase [bacterium]